MDTPWILLTFALLLSGNATVLAVVWESSGEEPPEMGTAEVPEDVDWPQAA